MSDVEQPLRLSEAVDEGLDEESASVWSHPLQWLKQNARKLKREVLVLYCASADPRLPLMAKVWAAIIIGYALSPLDLIPDWIPVLGILDDLILVPVGIWALLRMVPEDVMQDARVRAAEYESGANTRLPRNYVAGTVVALIWIAGAVWLYFAIKHSFFK